MTEAEAKAIEQGGRLRQLRLRCGLSLRLTAELQGLPPRTLNDIELGKLAVSDEHASIMAQRLELAAK